MGLSLCMEPRLALCSLTLASKCDNFQGIEGEWSTEGKCSLLPFNLGSILTNDHANSGYVME